MGRAVSDLKKSRRCTAAQIAPSRDLPAKAVFAGVAVVFVAMILLYHYFISRELATLSSFSCIIRRLVALRDDHRRIFFAAVSGKPGRNDRLVKQSRFRTPRSARW